MGSTNDFLFQGKPPPSVKSYGTTTTQVPQFLFDYMQGTLNKANQLAALPYQTYGGQRIAGVDPNLQQAWNMAGQNAGSWKPAFGSANAQLGAAAGASAAGAAQPWMTQAGQSAASTVSGYMSPYMSLVTDQIAQKGQQNLQSTLHTLGDDFIRAGSLGGSRQISAAGDAATKMQEAVSNAQSQALNTGYQSAMGAAQNDLSRYASIGQTMGNLTSADAQVDLNAANGYLNLGKATQAAGVTDAAALEAAGRGAMGEQQKNLDLAYQDFQNQTQYPYQMVDWMSGLTRGQPNMGNTVYSDSNAPLPGAQYGPSGLAQIAGGLSLMGSLGNLFKAKGGYIDADEALASGYQSAPRRRIGMARAKGYSDYKGAF